MSIRLQHLREAWSFLSTFVGRVGEIAVDTTNNRMVVHDGTTSGGWPAAKLSEVVTNKRTAVADANYTILVADRLVAYTSLTAARAVTLPAASTYPTGISLTIVDESGACSATNTLTINRVGSDTINGATSAVVSMAHGFVALESDGASKWTVVDQSGFDTLSTAGVAGFHGKVGIGTTTPAQPLDVVGNIAISGTTVVNSSRGGSFTTLSISDIATFQPATDHVLLIRGDPTPFGLPSGLLGPILEGTNSAQNVVTPLTIFAASINLMNGKVGIGTTAPAQPLDVVGNIQTRGAYGSNIQIVAIEDLITCSGASSVSTQQIPNRAIILAVSVYVVTGVTGATSFNVDATTSSSGGAGTTAGQFGASLGITAGSSNVGVIGPTAWYAASTIKLTANGANFTGGQVRISIQYMLCGAPTS